MPITRRFSNLYLNLLLFCGVCFGLLLGLYLSLTYGFFTGMAAGLLTGIIFAVLLSGALFLMQVISVRMTPYGLSKDNIGVYQVRTLEMKVPYEEAFILCEASLATIKGATIRSENREEGRIDARTGINWKTLGDDISIDVLKADNGQRIRVVSRPAVMTSVVDYGQNLENVEKIAGYLKAHGANTPNTKK